MPLASSASASVPLVLTAGLSLDLRRWMGFHCQLAAGKRHRKSGCSCDSEGCMTRPGTGELGQREVQPWWPHPTSWFRLLSYASVGQRALNQEQPAGHPLQRNTPLLQQQLMYARLPQFVSLETEGIELCMLEQCITSSMQRKLRSIIMPCRLTHLEPCLASDHTASTLLSILQTFG